MRERDDWSHGGEVTQQPLGRGSPASGHSSVYLALPYIRLNFFAETAYPSAPFF
jgi:hypothetical protein